MIRRLLVLLAAGLFLAWWLRRLVAGFASNGKHRASPAGGERQAEPMVRDRVCNTFLPRSRALIEHVGPEEFFFCSERCRGTFLAERTARQD